MACGMTWLRSLRGVPISSIAARGPGIGRSRGVLTRIQLRTISTENKSERNKSVSPGPSRERPRRSFNGWLAGLTVGSLSIASYYAWKDYENRKRSSSSLNLDFAKPKYASKEDFARALVELKQVLGDDNVSIDDDDLKRHGYSEWSTFNIDKLPIVIVYPSSTDDVSKMAAICHKYKLPVVAYAGGSSLEGSISFLHGGACVDFGRMNKIIAIRPDDLDATVQPSVGWMDLNARLKELGTGLFFGVDPSPIACFGGMVATCCSGTNCVRYGPMRDNVVNLTVVLADGTVVKTRGRPRKTAAGYNLTHLFTGSEGTLGLVTEITVKLQVVPETIQVGICSFPTVKDATSASIDVIRAGIPVQCMELMDDVQMWALNKGGISKRKWDEAPTIFFKFGGSKQYVDEQISKAGKISEAHGGGKFIFTKSQQEMEDLWSARKQVLWSLLALGPPNGRHWATDVAVPLSQLAACVEDAKKELRKLGLLATVLGHVGDGNFHCSIIYDPNNKEETERVEHFAHRLAEIAISKEGTVSGEHGVGASKIDLLVEELGPETVDLMRTIKLTVDPHQILNPGKIFTDETIIRGFEQEKIKQQSTLKA